MNDELALDAKGFYTITTSYHSNEIIVKKTMEGGRQVEAYRCEEIEVYI